jgi:hypothetical protein
MNKPLPSMQIPLFSRNISISFYNLRVLLIVLQARRLVNIFISTKGKNFKINISAGQNKMAAEAAMFELEKLFSFSLLIS